jgi:hypothetical protein
MSVAWNQTFGIRATMFLCGGVFGFLLSLGLQKHSYESGFEDGFWICVSGLDEVAQSEHGVENE